MMLRPLSCLVVVAVAALLTASIVAQEPASLVPIPGSAVVPPHGSVTFWSPGPTPSAVPGGGPTVVRSPASAILEVRSEADREVVAAYDGAMLRLTGPADTVVRVTSLMSAVPATCIDDNAPAPVVQCQVSSTGLGAAVTFTTITRGSGIEAALHLTDPRPCIPEPGQDVCARDRAALWEGDAAAWAARGVTNPDTRFARTVALRVQAGDPAAISVLARQLGWPYVKVTRLRFIGGVTEPEFVEVANLGGAPQDLTDWSIRSPERQTQGTLPEQPPAGVVRFPAGFVLAPGQSCRLAYGGRPDPASCGQSGLDVPQFWPDDAGTVVLTDDALALLADQTRYRSDPADQPPPPDLQLVPLGAADR